MVAPHVACLRRGCRGSRRPSRWKGGTSHWHRGACSGDGRSTDSNRHHAKGAEGMVGRGWERAARSGEALCRGNEKDEKVGGGASGALIHNVLKTQANLV